MHDEQMRRRKARKILSVLHHYLGSSDLAGLRTLDIGCSAGFIANELAVDGAISTGVDIDVPGIETAKARFGERVEFVCTSADEMPFPDESLDIVVFNHIYEHVVDADAVVSEIHRVLKPTGVVYLGLGNKFQLMEPHYKLPLLSWLPQGAADAYIKRAGKADEYYEKHRSKAGLQQLMRGFHIYDYTLPIIRNPGVYGSGDQVNGGVSRLPLSVLKALTPIIPTYVWIGTKQYRTPSTADSRDGLQHYDLTVPGRG
jgi:2-polyprenyl-3-methyl-5-hydroxy-6-metoxy-1,4-benzoquinol methylase